MFAQPVSLLDRVRNTPASVTTLNLSRNSLGYKTGAELAQAFAAIPASVTTLDLRGNALGSKTGAELAQAFAAIPASVTTLDLRGNDLGNKTGAKLAQAFAAIPASVTTLDLSRNWLDRKTGAELAQAFAAIPVTVGYLKNHDIPMAVFESLEHPISWMAKAKGLLELDRTSTEVNTYRTDALNLLLAIPPESPLYREAAQVLWVDLYVEYLSQYTSSTMPFAVDVGVVSEATTTISFSMVREYALAAAKGNTLLSMVYPGINNDGFGPIDSESEFMLCSEYITRMKASGKGNDEIHLTQDNLSQFKAHMQQNGNIECGPGYGF